MNTNKEKAQRKHTYIYSLKQTNKNNKHKSIELETIKP